MTMNPTFEHLMTLYAELDAAGLGDTDEANMLLSEAMTYAPPEFMAAAAQEARRLGLMPERPSGYLDDGTPCYSIADIAAQLGKSAAEVERELARLLELRTAMGFSNEGVAFAPTAVHRVQ